MVVGNMMAKMRNRGQALMLLAVVLVPLVPFGFANQPQQESGTEALWMDLSIGPPLIALFNETGRPEDIARVEHPSRAGQLNDITVGQKLVVFKSISDAEALLPQLAEQIDIVGYNFESGPATPPEEQADPVGSIQRMRALTDSYGLKLFLGPDYNFATSHGPEMAPHVDYMVLQIQRQQTNPEVVRAFVEPLVPLLRAANPDIQISVQVRTEGDVDALVALIESLLPYLDGISILTSPETVDVAQELVAALRPGAGGGGGGFELFLPFVLVVGVVVVGVLVLRWRRQGELSA